MATDKETVALQDLVTLDLSATADLFGCLQIANVLQAPGLSRFTTSYDRVRFLKLRVEFFATGYAVTALSTVSQSEKGYVSEQRCYFETKELPVSQFETVRWNELFANV